MKTEVLRNQLESIADGADIHEVRTLASLLYYIEEDGLACLDKAIGVVNEALRTRDFSLAGARIRKLAGSGDEPVAKGPRADMG